MRWQATTPEATLPLRSRLTQSHLFQLAVERFALDAQEFRGFGFVATGRGENLADLLRFRFAQRPRSHRLGLCWTCCRIWPFPRRSVERSFRRAPGRNRDVDVFVGHLAVRFRLRHGLAIL